MSVKVLVLRAPGINCEVETAHAFARQGAEPELVHVRRLLERPELLDQFRVFVVPGGFAYGDDLAAGRVLAHQLRTHVGQRLVQFIDRGGFALGICNGFQALIKLGLLPRTGAGGLVQEATLVHNDSNHYECRWVRLRSEASRCVFLPKGLVLEMPAAHGEGKYVPASPALHQVLSSEGFVALRYVRLAAGGGYEPAGGRFPQNPNGALDDVAGLTDVTGRVLGLMPHPDRAYLPHLMPRWQREGLAANGDGNEVFRLLVAAARG